MNRTPSSEHFSDRKNVFQSVDLQVQSGQHTKAAPKYTHLTTGDFPVASYHRETHAGAPYAASSLCL